MLNALYTVLWLFIPLWLLGYCIVCFTEPDHTKATGFYVIAGFMLAVLFALCLFCIIMAAHTLTGIR